MCLILCPCLLASLSFPGLRRRFRGRERGGPAGRVSHGPGMARAPQAVTQSKGSEAALLFRHIYCFLSFRRKPESRANRARNAHIRAMAAAGDSANLWPSAFPSLRHEGARSARFIRWIPAFAGMARWGHGSGGVGFIRWMPIGFLHGLESRNPAQIQRGTRTLQRRTACRSLQGARSARFLCGIPAFAGMTRWGHGNDGVGAWE